MTCQQTKYKLSWQDQHNLGPTGRSWPGKLRIWPVKFKHALMCCFAWWSPLELGPCRLATPPDHPGSGRARRGQKTGNKRSQKKARKCHETGNKRSPNRKPAESWGFLKEKLYYCKELKVKSQNQVSRVKSRESGSEKSDVYWRKINKVPLMMRIGVVFSRPVVINQFSQ